MPATGHKAERSCIGCRRALAQDQLVRYVVGPDEKILVDYRHRLPGRGAYTCLDRQCLTAAVKRSQFARAFRRPVAGVSAEELCADLRRQLLDRIVGLLGMARKAGQAISGSSLVLGALGGATPPGIVVIAADTSPAIAEKVAGKAAAVGVPVWKGLDKGTLGHILGKGERSVVAVKDHPLAASLGTEVFRYLHIAGES